MTNKDTNINYELVSQSEDDNIINTRRCYNLTLLRIIGDFEYKLCIESLDDAKKFFEILYKYINNCATAYDRKIIMERFNINNNRDMLSKKTAVFFMKCINSQYKLGQLSSKWNYNNNKTQTYKNKKI